MTASTSPATRRVARKRKAIKAVKAVKALEQKPPAEAEPLDKREEYEEGLNTLVGLIMIVVAAVYMTTSINSPPRLYEPPPPPPPPTMEEKLTAWLTRFLKSVQIR